MINYLIELAIVHVSLVLGYWFFLRNEQHFASMRSYLIASTILALLIPLLQLPKLFSFSHDPLVIMPMEAKPVESIPTDTMSLDAESIVASATRSARGYELIIWTYITVSSFFLVRLFSGIFYLIKLEGKSRCEKVNGMIIRRSKNINGSFTFFNWIFLSDEIESPEHDNEAILQHEKAHAFLGHTYDIMFFELFKACFWWLPTVWIALKEIKKIHEYQADAVAIKTCDVDRYSSVLISSTLNTNGLNLPAMQGKSRRQTGLPASSFDDGLILKRLKTMKQQARNVSPLKLTVLSVFCAALFITLACTEEKPVHAAVSEIDVEFEGGLEAFYNYIQQEIKYPLQARKAGVEGLVEVEFVVDRDGSISDAEAITRIGAGCGEEAVRAVKSLPWFKPATQNGKPVRVRRIVPVVFELKAGETNPDKSTQGTVIIEKMQPKNYMLKIETDYVNGEWTGTVYDQWYDELPGANIVVPGTTAATTSAEDGTFKLKAEEGHGIVVTFVGYETVAIMKSLFDQPGNWADIASHPKIHANVR